MFDAQHLGLYRRRVDVTRARELRRSRTTNAEPLRDSPDGKGFSKGVKRKPAG
jgi:hypothetical protein